MRSVSPKTKFRVTILLLVIIISLVVFVSSGVSYFSQISKTNKEIEELKEKYDEKLNDEEALKDEINKLQDPEYMARYAREKYLYSKKGEIIIKIEE